MAKSFKYKNEKYLDSAGIVHNKELLSDILNKSTADAQIFSYEPYTVIYANAWRYILGNDSKVSLKKGRYLVIASVAVQSSGNGIVTLRPIINGSEINSTVRMTIPLNANLRSSCQVIFYYKLEQDTTITYDGQLYSNVQCDAPMFRMTFIPI